MWSIRNLVKVYPESDHIMTSLRNSSLAYDANQCEMICGLILISNYFYENQWFINNKCVSVMQKMECF